MRVKELDLVKTFILVFTLVGIHSLYDLTTLDVETNVLGGLLNVLGGTFGAPIFMFCMGMTLGFSRHQSAGDWVRRGVQLITIGMVLNILRYAPMAFHAYMTGEEELMKGLAMIYNVDIMQFAGLAFMLLALLQVLKMNHWGVLLTGVLLNVAGSLLEGHHPEGYVLSQVLGYFYPTPTCCCFPLMNWFIFVAAGNTMGVLYRGMDNAAISRFFRWVMPIGGVITVVYMYLTIVVEVPCLRTLQGDWGLYWMIPFDALPTALAVAPFCLGVFRAIGKVIPDNWMSVLSYPSRHINSFYCVSWVWIMWVAHIFLFVPKAETTMGFVGMWVSMIVLTLLSVMVYDKYLQNRADPFFSRHAKGITIGVWVVLILFGVWYFSTIPGPYIMPY